MKDADSDLPEALRPIFGEACQEIRAIEARIKPVERQLEAPAEQMPAVEHLRTMSGLNRNLGRISKRGDGYLRTLLIHGARSVLVHARKQQPDRLREWANKLSQTHVHNKAAVAVANKLARIIWAVWTHQRPFALMAKAA